MSGAVQVLDRAKLDVEQIADLSMRVGLLADAVELQIGDAEARVASLSCEVRLLREADAVGGRLHAEVADRARVSDRVEEDRRDRRLAARELHRHLPPRLDPDRIVEQLLDLVERELVDVPDLVRVHEARVAHHVAAIRQIDRQHGAAPVFDRRRPVIVQIAGVRRVVASGEEGFDALEERGVDRERVAERAVLRARLLDHDVPVAFDDGRGNLADVLVNQRVDRLLARENACTRLTDACGTERIRAARPAKRRP